MVKQNKTKNPLDFAQHNAMEKNEAGEELGNGQKTGVGCNFTWSDQGRLLLEK